MTDLTEFLLARLTEDERAARAVKPLDVIYPMGGRAHPQQFTHARLSFASEDGYPRSLDDREASAHFGRPLGSPGTWTPNEAWPCETVRLLALPYADHPDYREEWRP